MGTYKKASRRLVQPQPKHYKQRVRDDGNIEDVLCGPYTLEQRDQYFEVMISLYLTRHAAQTRAKARQATFQRWRMLVFATIGDEYKPPTTAKPSKDAVELLDKSKPRKG